MALVGGQQRRQERQLRWAGLAAMQRTMVMEIALVSAMTRKRHPKRPD